VALCSRIDTQTNNHETGVRYLWGGKTSELLPSLAALHAARVESMQRLPATYVSTGGYDVTDGVVPLTRLAEGSQLLRAVHVDVVEPGNALATLGSVTGECPLLSVSVKTGDTAGRKGKVP
jgi:hypothetical protein